MLVNLLTRSVLTAFTNRCAAFISSPSSLSSPSSSLSESLIGTTDVEAVTEALVRAVNYNMQRKYMPTSLMFHLATINPLDNVVPLFKQLLTLHRVWYLCSQFVLEAHIHGVYLQLWTA